MKTRKKLDRFFALLLVFALIFNSQATALLAMEGEPVTEIAGSGTEPLAGTEGDAETVDGDAAVIPDGEATGDPAESGMQEEAQGEDFVLDEESVPGSDSASGQDDGAAEGQENAGENAAGTQESEPESKIEQSADAEPEIGQADPSVSGQENLSGSVTEDETGADEESGPALDVEEDSDITIVDEETEPQEPETDEAETEEEYEAEVVAMGLDDGIMLTSLEGEDNEAKVIKASGSETEYATFAEAVANAGDGDTVQLLRNTEEINTQISVSKSITIDLGEHDVTFSSTTEETSKNKTTTQKLVVTSGADLTITGAGSITGGCYETYQISSGKVPVYKTIEVAQGGMLTVQGQAKIESIVNFGSTKLKDNVQVTRIRQLGDTFILDNILTAPLEIMLGIDNSNKTNYLKIGDRFSIEESTKVTVSFINSYYASMNFNLGITYGKKVINGKNGTWLTKPDQDNPFALMLFTPENTANNDILNMLAEKIDIPNIVEMDVDESKKDEQGYPMKDEDGNTIYIKKTKTVEIRVEDGSIVLRKFYRYKDEPDKEPGETDRVYVSNKGEDSNGRGFSSALPVKTMTKAIELVKKDITKKKIYILDTLEINDTQEWGDLPEGVTIERYEGFTGAFANVIKNGNLTLQNIEIMGNGKPSDSLFEVSAGGKLVLNEKAVLSDNDHDHSKSSSYGGAIKNNNGTIEVNGGTIKNCKAYNGGAIYCNGGKLIMVNGLLTENSAVEAGGAIMLANGAVMELNDGEISGNDTALHRTGEAYGGGIAVGGYTSDSIQISPELHMTGGTITNNNATRCGGGIFIQANARALITGGTISDNDAGNAQNFGGGGIYVNGKRGEIDGNAEKEGYLYLENALIIGNYSRKMYGGGIAGCDTSSVCIYLSKGAAIYGNTRHYGDGLYNHYKSDIYIARSPYTNTNINISEYARNGQPYLWKEEESNNDVAANKLHKNMALDLYTDEPFSENEKEYNVIIKGNHADVSGGGIGTNGTVVIGEESDSTNITVCKTWEDDRRVSNRPIGEIKVLLRRKLEGETDDKYQDVAAAYLTKGSDGTWGNVTFTDQPTHDPSTGKTYVYTVREDTEGIGPYVSTVTKGEGDVDWVITNTYTPAPTTATIAGTKELTGREWKDDDEFTFELTEATEPKVGDTAVPDKLTDKLTAKATKAAQNFDFGEIKYTEPYVHTYTVKETSKSGKGITVDGNTYTVTVTVTDNEKGALNATVIYPQKEKDEEGKETGTLAAKLTFTNTYTAKAGTATVNATKTLTGRPKDLQANEFEFSLTPKSAVDAADKAITDPNAEQTGVKNDAAGKITFAALNYTQAGTYTYELKETSTDGNGVTVAGTVYTVTVRVTDNNEGQLEASVAYSKGTETVDAKDVVFANTYKAAEGTASVSATKTLTGRPKGLQANEFAFSLTPVGAVGTDGETAITDPNAAQKDVKNDGDGKITFAALNYTQAGTYTYELRETSKSGKGVTVAGTVYTVTVRVTDNNEGQLETSVAYSKGTEAVDAKDVVFANTYKAAEGTASVSATKTLTGRPKGLQANEFAFSLTPVGAVGTDGETAITDPKAAQNDVKNDGDGKITFAALKYTQAGTYTYELKETSTDGNGVTVAGTVYTVTVRVTDNNEGQLETSVAYSKGTEAVDAKDVVFVNTYKAAEGTASVSATKTLTGRADGLQDKEFSFSLTPVGAVGTDGETAVTDPNAAQTAQNDGAGKVTFADLSYTQAGTYTYEMKEAATDEAGITTDPTVYTVTVSVTDDNAGQLETSVAYSSGTVAVDAGDVVFANTYKAADNSIRLGATKVFDRTLAGGEFTFVLQEVDQDGHVAAGGVRQEKTNGSDGKILFNEITYDKEGTHHYQISETAGSDPTVLAYDAALYTVTVNVKDEGAKLVATADLTADEVVFTNRSTKVKIDKQDADTGVSVAGAVLRIVDKDQAGAAVEQWTTDGTPHEITGKLRKNGSYTLEELSAPDGYLPTGPIDFTVNEKGETVIGGQVTDMVVMRDTKNTVSLLKLDENGKPLPGAHLVIETADGTAVDSWVSDGTPHVARGLARGHYALSEVEAPEGYHVAEDVPFEITGAETQPVEVQMSDTKIPEKDQNKLTVMKHLHLDGISSDIGVHEAVFYVALFSDEAKTHRISDVKALTFRDSAVSTATFENLGKGTYYIGETDENGILKESEVVNDRVIYYAEYGDNAKVEFEGRKGEATGELTNVYVEIPEDISFYLSGRLTITKKVLVGGEEAVSDSTFYARIFEDAELTRANSDVIALEMNGGSKASVTVYDLPIGETLDSSATYYVAETDENGTPLDPDAVTEYQISVDRSEIVLDADHSDQEVVITNDFVEEETETETEEETDVPDAPGTASGSGTPAPRTGDETDYLLYLLYMAFSAGLFAVAAGEKRRRKGRVKK